MYAKTQHPILITGCAGLYQWSLARYIHEQSQRKACSFLSIDASCSGPDMFSRIRELLASADGGSVLVDNLDLAPREFQSFLCQYMKQSESSWPASASHPLPDIRFFFTAERLEHLTDRSRFLPDLFYRISPLILGLPHLKDMREHLYTFYSLYMHTLLKNTGLEIDTIFSIQLWNFLTLVYDYPGNFQELEGICRYFTCIYTGKRLTVNDLPPYIPFRSAKLTAPLPAQELEILRLIQENPHCGRNKIAVLLSGRGFSMTPSQIRTTLSRLDEKGCIQILKTRQGCHITELGEYTLSQYGRRSL